MQIGSLVVYTPRDTEQYPAIVLGVWDSGEAQLVAFHSEGHIYVRAAHPSTVGHVVDPEDVLDLLLFRANTELRLQKIERHLGFTDEELNEPALIEAGGGESESHVASTRKMKR